jgi:hypothetical protein
LKQEILTFEEWVLCGNPLQQFGSGLELDPEPTREFGPVANTRHSQTDLTIFSHVCFCMLDPETC